MSSYIPRNGKRQIAPNDLNRAAIRRLRRTAKRAGKKHAADLIPRSDLVDLVDTVEALLTQDEAQAPELAELLAAAREAREAAIAVLALQEDQT